MNRESEPVDDYITMNPSSIYVPMNASGISSVEEEIYQANEEVQNKRDLPSIQEEETEIPKSPFYFPKTSPTYSNTPIYNNTPIPTKKNTPISTTEYLDPNAYLPPRILSNSSSTQNISTLEYMTQRVTGVSPVPVALPHKPANTSANTFSSTPPNVYNTLHTHGSTHSLRGLLPSSSSTLPRTFIRPLPAPPSKKESVPASGEETEKKISTQTPSKSKERGRRSIHSSSGESKRKHSVFGRKSTKRVHSVSFENTANSLQDPIVAISLRESQRDPEQMERREGRRGRSKRVIHSIPRHSREERHNRFWNLLRIIYLFIFLPFFLFFLLLILFSFFFLRIHLKTSMEEVSFSFLYTTV